MSEVTTHDITISYKGFDQNLCCRGHQYQIGQTYHFPGKIEACVNGAHACEHPLNCFDYYAPAGSRFCEVHQSGETSRGGGDTKLASATITIGVELSIGDMVARAIKWVFDRSKTEGESATGYQGAASATGYQGAASATGYQGAASATGDQGAASATGDRGAASATGYQGAASATGDRGAASATGDRGAASATRYQGAASATGDQGAASATGDRGAASATGDQGAASATGDRGAASATGDQGAASATGDRGAASATGDQGAASATGEKSCAAAFGFGARARAAAGGAIFLTCRDEDDNIVCVRASKVGENGVEPDVWYSLNEAGDFVKAGAA